MYDCFTELPKEAGKYNVMIPGVRSFLPIFWKFDGEKWETNTLAKPLDGPGQAYWYDN